MGCFGRIEMWGRGVGTFSGVGFGYSSGFEIKDGVQRGLV